MPKISIIMGVLNAQNRIRRSVNSIIEQTYEDWEFIICDDGSKDDTFDILEKMSLSDKRIIVIRNKTNRGLAFSLNKCISMSKGAYLARMDDDDIALPQRLEKQISFLESNPKISIIGTSRTLFDEKGIWGSDIRSGEVSKADVFKGYPFVHPTVLMRKKDVESVGCYTVSKITKRTEDIDLWIKMYEKGYVGYNLSDILLNYFESENSYSKRKYVHRFHEFLIRIGAMKKLEIKWWLFLYPFKTLASGLIPRFIMIRIKSKRYSNTRS